MSMTPLRFSFHGALTAWQWGPFPLLVLATVIALAYWYLRADWKLAGRRRSWPASRTLCFMGGLVLVDLALQGPVATFAGSYFQAHVVQHLLLMVGAPVLLALGTPSTLLLQSSGRPAKIRWLRVLRSRPFALLTHPVVVWFLYFGIMLIFFLSPLINYAMEHMALMDVINLTFLLGGCLYWWPLVGLDPIVHWKMGYGARMFNVLLGGPVESWLGIAIMSDRNPVASMYTVMGTHAGGAMLWGATEFATLIAFMPIVAQWYRSEQRQGVRLDKQSDRLAVTSGGPPATGTMSAWEAAWVGRVGAVPGVRRAAVDRPPAMESARCETGGTSALPALPRSSWPARAD